MLDPTPAAICDEQIPTLLIDPKSSSHILSLGVDRHLPSVQVHGAWCYSTAQWHRHRAPSSSCSLKLRPRHNEHTLISFFSSSRHLPTNSLLTAKLFPLLCRFLSFLFFHCARNHVSRSKRRQASIAGWIWKCAEVVIQYPKSSQLSSDCSRLETCSQTCHGIWHAESSASAKVRGSCRLIRPRGSWHVAMFMLSRTLVPASWHRFNHTARSALGPWLIHATQVHLRFSSCCYIQPLPQS
ncbi:hypothetical protein J3F84DRAFT_156921 [Trichoderma pleuroticola]